jgi:hypothetical protein
MAISISRSGGNIYDAASAILRARAAGGSGGSSGGGSGGGSSGGSGGSGSSGGSGLTQDERDALKRQQKLEDDARNRQQDLEDDARTRQQKLEDAAQKREDDARKQEAEDKAYAKKYGDDALREAQEQRYKAEDDARKQEAEDKAYAKKYGDDALRAAQERRYEIEDDARRQAAEDKAYAKKYGDESLRDAQEQKYKIEDDERKREDEALKRKYKEADDALKREDEALAQKKKREDAAQEQKYKIEDDARAQASKDREYAKKYGNEALADAQKQRYKIEDDARQQANQEKNTAADQANKIANAAQDQANNERNAAIDAGNDAQQAAQGAANDSALAGQRAAASAGNAAQQQMYNRENALRQQGYRSWNDRQKNQFTSERDARREQDRIRREERAQKYKIEILGIKDEKQQLNATQKASLRSYEKWQDRVDEAYANGLVFSPEEEKALLEEEIAFNQGLEDPEYDDEGVRQAMRREFQQKRAAKLPTTRKQTPTQERGEQYDTDPDGKTWRRTKNGWERWEDPEIAHARDLAKQTALQGEKAKEDRRKQANDRQDAIDKAEEFYRSKTQPEDDRKPLYTEEYVRRQAREKVKESEKDRYPDLPPIPDDPTTTPGPVVQPQPPVDAGRVRPVDPTITPPTRVRKMGAWKDLNDDGNGVTKDGITYEQWQAMRNDLAAIARWEAGSDPFGQATQQPTAPVFAPEDALPAPGQPAPQSTATGLNQTIGQSGITLPGNAGANVQQPPAGGTPLTMFGYTSGVDNSGATMGIGSPAQTQSQAPVAPQPGTPGQGGVDNTRDDVMQTQTQAPVMNPDNAEGIARGLFETHGRNGPGEDSPDYETWIRAMGMIKFKGLGQTQ